MSPHINVDLIERMQIVFDDIILISLLEEFVQLLQIMRSDFDEIPQDCNDALLFLSVKLRGAASEYGANRLVEIARTMERSLKDSPRNAVDWRLLLRAEIDETIGAYRGMIELLRCMPLVEPRLKLVSSA
jgi:hypothetical protein